jgi:hypothetical protein
MKKFLAAIALTIALPTMAQAQAATAAPKADCCAKMKDMACCKDGKMDCCKDMAKMDHSKHDMSKMDHSMHDMKAGTDPHAGHDMSKPAAQAPAAATHNHQN